MTTALFGSAKKKLRRYNVPGSPCNRLRKRVCRTTPHCNYVPYRGCRRSSITRVGLPESQPEGILNDAVNTAKFKHLKEIAKNVIKKNGSHEKAVAALSESAAKMRVPQQNIERVVDDAVAIAKVEHVQNVAKSVIKNKGVSRDDALSAVEQAAQDLDIPHENVQSISDEVVATANAEQVKDIAKQAIKESGGSHTKTVAAATKEVNKIAKKSFKNKAIVLKNAGKLVKKEPVKPVNLPKKSFKQAATDVKNAGKMAKKPVVKPVVAAPKKSFKQAATDVKKVIPIVKAKKPQTTVPKVNLKKVTPSVKAEIPHTTIPKVKLKKVTPSVKAKTPPPPPPPPPLKKVTPVAKSKKEPVTLQNVKLKKVKPKTKQPAKKPSIADKYKTTGMDKDLAEKLARRRALSEFGKKRKTVLRKKKINNFEIKYLNNL